MNFDSLFPIFFCVVFIFMLGSFGYKIIKHGGFKGAMFGAPIKTTVGEVSCAGPRPIRMVVKVHSLGGDSREKAVGVELVAKSFASYQMMPISLSKEDARKLATLLESAAR